MELTSDDEVIGVVVYKVLKALTPAIDNIDGEYSVCIKQFIKDANQELERLKIPYRYNYNDENKVEVLL